MPNFVNNALKYKLKFVVQLVLCVEYIPELFHQLIVDPTHLKWLFHNLILAIILISNRIQKHIYIYIYICIYLLTLPVTQVYEQ